MEDAPPVEGKAGQQVGDAQEHVQRADVPDGVVDRRREAGGRDDEQDDADHDAGERTHDRGQELVGRGVLGLDVGGAPEHEQPDPRDGQPSEARHPRVRELVGEDRAQE